jgi:hypothetical protein
VVEVDADGEQHDEDGGGDPVDDRAERRPPASVGDELAAAIPASTAMTRGRPSATAKPM